MARFNEILVGRFNRAVQKLLSMKGPAALVTVSDEMMPILKMADLTSVEDRYLMSWNRFGIISAQAAVAAQNGIFEMRNPLTSNIVAVFERIFVFPTVGNLADAPQLATGALATDLATAVSLATSQLDARTSPGSALVMSRTTTAGGTQVPAKFEINWTATIGGGDFIWDVNQEIPLFPGWAMQCISNVANQALSISVLWRERFLEDSERT